MVTQLLVVATATGTPGYSVDTSPGCPPLEVLGMVPYDGAVVPVDTMFRAVVEPAYEACYSPILELFDALGAPVSSLVEQRGNGLWSLTSVAPLVLGETYTFRVSDSVYVDRFAQVTVTVGEPPPPPTDVPELVLAVDHLCGDGRVNAAVHLETSEPVSGLMTVDYLVDGTLTTVYRPLSGQAVFEDHQTFWGGVAVCASARFEDLSGDEVWSVGPACAPEYRCPTYAPPAEVTFSMDAVCDMGQPSTHLVADVDLPPADPAARGTLGVEVTTDLGSQGFPWSAEVVGADADPHVDVTVLGGHEVCFELVMFDPYGVEVWRDGPHCSEEPVTCPAEAREPSAAEGCGCDGTSGAGGLLAPAVALVLRRRRRS